MRERERERERERNREENKVVGLRVGIWILGFKVRSSGKKLEEFGVGFTD